MSIIKAVTALVCLVVFVGFIVMVEGCKGSLTPPPPPIAQTRHY